MDKPVKITDWGMGLRRSFYGQIVFSIFLLPVLATLLVTIGVFILSLLLSSVFEFNDQTGTWRDFLNITFFAFLFFCCAGLVNAIITFRQGAAFHCPHCTQFVPHDYIWACGYCSYTNAPYYERGQYNHFFSSCGKCHSIPSSILCPNKECKQWITLTVPGPYGVHGNHNTTLPEPEPPEIAELRRQQQLERVKRQYYEELEREDRRARAKQMSSNLEILAEKIMLTKQFEEEALAMVKNLKDKGKLNGKEEGVLLEMIQDKVLEEFHVDRRGGRTR